MRILLTGLIAVLLCGCAAKEPSDKTTTVGIQDVEAATLIRAHEDFNEPIYLEIWSNSHGPTAERLREAGWLELTGEQTQILRITERGLALGAQKKEFQSGIPVYRIPVGRRELIEVQPVEITGSEPQRLLGFRYRRSPTEVGEMLLDAGIRVDIVRSSRVLDGRILVGTGDSGWRIELINL